MRQLDLARRDAILGICGIPPWEIGRMYHFQINSILKGYIDVATKLRGS